MHVWYNMYILQQYFTFFTNSVAVLLAYMYTVATLLVQTLKLNIMMDTCTYVCLIRLYAPILYIDRL